MSSARLLDTYSCSDKRGVQEIDAQLYVMPLKDSIDLHLADERE